MEQLATIDGKGPATTIRSLESEIGLSLLRLGELDEAVAHLSRANALASGDVAARRKTLHDLAVAELRRGETRNCVARHNADSCLWPLGSAAVHRDRDGSTKAIVQLEELLTLDPSDAVARWLLNLAWMTLGEWPARVAPPLRLPARLFAASEPFPRFPNVARAAGFHEPMLSGGVVADDFDHDGDIDLLRSTVDPREHLRYYENNGRGHFSERAFSATAADVAGVAGVIGGLNLVSGDYDNDGNLDVVVLRGAWLRRAGRIPNALLEGGAGGRFTDVTARAGLEFPAWPTQAAAFADYDRDGDIDLFIGNEADAGEPYPSQLFRNEGDGTFRDVAVLAGVENLAYAKGAAWGDFDDDGWPDLYVSNLGGPNRLYHNQRDGSFVDVAVREGVERPAQSFACGWFDFDQDGALDLLALPYTPDTGSLIRAWLELPDPGGRPESPRLYRNAGAAAGPGARAAAGARAARFREVGGAMGLGRPLSAMGANVGDIDGDGWPDLYIGTGSPALDALMPNVMYRNRAGRAFADVTVAGGFGHLQKGHAMAIADVDGDGDLDVFAALGGAWPVDLANDALFENPGSGHHWIGLRLVGTASSRSAIGARVRVEVEERGKRRSIYKWIDGGLSFGASPLDPIIGLGAAERVAAIEVRWPATGAIERVPDVAVDRWIEIVERATSRR